MGEGRELREILGACRDLLEAWRDSGQIRRRCGGDTEEIRVARYGWIEVEKTSQLFLAKDREVKEG